MTKLMFLSYSISIRVVLKLHFRSVRMSWFMHFLIVIVSSFRLYSSSYSAVWIDLRIHPLFWIMCPTLRFKWVVKNQKNRISTGYFHDYYWDTSSIRNLSLSRRSSEVSFSHLRVRMSLKKKKSPDESQWLYVIFSVTKGNDFTWVEINVIVSKEKADQVVGTDKTWYEQSFPRIQSSSSFSKKETVSSIEIGWTSYSRGWK